MYDQILKALRGELEKALKSHTQEEIAHLCETTQPTIQRIMSGSRGQNLPLRTVLNIIYGLNLDIRLVFSIPPPSTDKIRALLAEAVNLMEN